MSYVFINGRTILNIAHLIDADCTVDDKSGELKIVIELQEGKKHKVTGDEALKVWKQLFPDEDPPTSTPEKKERKAYRSIAAAPLKML